MIWAGDLAYLLNYFTDSILNVFATLYFHIHSFEQQYLHEIFAFQTADLLQSCIVTPFQWVLLVSDFLFNFLYFHF